MRRAANLIMKKAKTSTIVTKATNTNDNGFVGLMNSGVVDVRIHRGCSSPGCGTVSSDGFGADTPPVSPPLSWSAGVAVWDLSSPPVVGRSTRDRFAPCSEDVHLRSEEPPRTNSRVSTHVSL